jgi:uncharacterized membrane protein
MIRTQAGTAPVAVAVLVGLIVWGLVVGAVPATASGHSPVDQPAWEQSTDDRWDRMSPTTTATSATILESSARRTAQSDAEVSAVASDKQGDPGEKVTVAIDFESTSADRHLISHYTLDVEYDEDVLAFSKATPLELESVETMEGDGVVTLDREWKPSLTTWTDFTALKLEFVVVGEPGDETRIDVDALEIGSLVNDYETTTEDGTVTVTGSDSDDGEDDDGDGSDGDDGSEGGDEGDDGGDGNDDDDSGGDGDDGSEGDDGGDEEDDSGGADPPTTGTVSGTVTDESGSSLSDVRVSVGGQTATTGSDGTYEITTDAGAQPMRIEASGYQISSTVVTVPAGGTATPDVQLAPHPDDAKLGIVGASKVVNPGDTITIPIEAVTANGNEQDTLGYEIVFEYDPDVLQFKTAKGAAYEPTGTDTSRDGVVVVESRDPFSSNTVPFTGLNLEFEVVGDAGTDATVGIPVEYTKKDGSTKYPGFGNEVGAERSLPAYHVDSTVRIVDESTDGVGGGGDDGDTGDDGDDGESGDGGNGEDGDSSDDPEPGTVTGTVTNSEGESIQNAKVSVRNGETADRTSGDGSYELSLSPGTYTLEVAATGYETVSKLVEIENGTELEQSVSLESTGALVNINVTDASAGSGARVTVPVEVEDLRAGDKEAFGYVLTIEYDPDVVEFLDAKQASGFEVTDINTEIVADDRVVVNSTGGTAKRTPPYTATKLGFKLVGAPGETATIEMVPERNGRQVSGVGKSVQTPWPATYESGTISITDESVETQTGTIEGQVTDKSGDPIEGLSVDAEGALGSTKTDGDGQYSLTVENGSYDVSFSGEVYIDQTKSVTVDADETTTLDATLAELDRDVDIIVNGTTAPPGGQAVVDLEVKGVDSPDALVRGYGIMLQFDTDKLQFNGTAKSDEVPLKTTDIRRISDGVVLLNSTKATTETKPPFTAAKVVFDVVAENSTNATVGLVDTYQGRDVSTLGKTKQELYESGLVNGTITITTGAESDQATVSSTDSGSSLGGLIVDLGFLVGASGFFGALSVLALGIAGRFERT